MNVVVAVVGPTAAGKSALGVALAQRFDGEIVNCDSTAVYRGIDIGTDKVAPADQQGIPHHLIDIVDATAVYTAADFARDAARTIREITARGRLPILVGGTGFYVPGADTRPLRRPVTRRRPAGTARADRRASRGRGPASPGRRASIRRPAVRILPRDRKRLVRALEVYFKTGRPLTDHFADTRSPIADYDVVTIGVRIPAALTAERVSREGRPAVRAGRRRRGAAVARVGRARRRPRRSSGLVYRQVLEHLHGVRDEAATRALIVRENLQYARRQLIWFRKEPSLVWLDGPGEKPAVIDAAEALVRRHGVSR